MVNPDSAGIRLLLLGSPHVIDPTSRPINLHGRKPLALLAYLATTAPKIHTREEVATLFWPDLPRKDALNNLRVTLARNGGWKHLSIGKRIQGPTINVLGAAATECVIS
jgi:hypothetical protein